MRGRRLPARAAALLLAATAASASEATAQGGPILIVDGGARGLFDSNVGRSAVPVEVFGGGGDILLRAANRLRSPTLQLEYAASLRRSSPTHRTDGAGHQLNVLARAPLADWIRVDMIGRGSRGGTDDDMSTGDEVLLSSRVEIRPLRSMRLRGYGAQRWRRTDPAAAPSQGNYGGLELRQDVGGAATLLADVRYEEFRPPDSNRDWQRVAIVLGIGYSILRNTAVEAEARFREREHPRRLVPAGDGAAPRHDTDRRYGFAIVYDNGTGTEIRLELERDRRQSNAVDRGYAADRATFAVRRRIFAVGGRHDPPRIDDRPATDALRRDAADPLTGMAGSLSFNAVRVAGSGMCAVADDGVVCWPAPTTAMAAGAPVLIPGRWQRVASTEGRACGLDAEGRVHCWQWNGAFGERPSLETQLVHSDVRFREIAVGFGHACALTEEGTAYCWGDNAEGQLGTGLAIPASRPVAVVGGVLFKSITAGMRHTCALDLHGTAWCWGSNKSGQVAAGTLRRSLQPRRIDRHTFTTITAGTSHTCALTGTGRAYCWGESVRGQAGAAAGTVAGPIEVRADVPFITISAGWAHTCALSEAGRAYCWGANRFGQLGSGSVDENPHPTPVLVAGGFTFIDLNASFRTCALEAGGQLYCWGSTAHGAADPSTAQPGAVPLTASRRSR
jgi:alpha-tubulin suppressor-like RCC1 family protein